MLGPGSTGRPAAEVQLLVLATRGQEVTASGLEDRPVWGLSNGGGGHHQDERWMPSFGRRPGY